MEKTFKFDIARRDIKTSVKFFIGVATVALAIALPQFFHVFGGAAAGKIFLPMHLPILFAGLLLGAGWGFALGLCAPLMSFIVTSAFLGQAMPALSALPLMMLELSVYGLVCGLFSYFSAKKWWISYFVLPVAMLAGRLLKWLASYLISGASFSSALSSLADGYIGIIIQMLLLPLILWGANALIAKKK